MNWRFVRNAAPRRWRLVIAAVALLVGNQRAPAADTHARYEFTEPQMGVPFKIVVYAANDEIANRAARAAFARIEELNAILSDYEDDSELVRLSRGSPHDAPVKVSDDLFRVLALSEDLARRSQGAFDVSVGPLVQLWRRARRQRALPSAELLQRARAAVDYQAIKLDAKLKTVQLTKPRMRLDLGGIGIGYAVDEALVALKAGGIRSAMVDASGDIGTLDAPPGSLGWRIGIAPAGPKQAPTRYVLLNNAALAVSSDAYQHLEIDGVRYSHIVDPRTGLGLTDHSSVTVIANDCATADSYATAISVLGPKQGLALAGGTPGIEALIARLENGKPRTVETAGFASYEFKRE
jgi:thiamine biosynthesis lipoprotein